MEIIPDPNHPPAYTAPKRVEYAGFWLRFVAFLIDKLVLAVPSLIISWMFGMYRYSAMTTYESMGHIFRMVTHSISASLSLWCLQWLYFSLLESSPRQATVGKMALGIIVTDAAGNRISFARATGRYFSKIISGLLLGFGFLMAGWTSKKQGLHDIIAETLVVMQDTAHLENR